MPTVTKAFEILLLEDEPADAYLGSLHFRTKVVNSSN